MHRPAGAKYVTEPGTKAPDLGAFSSQAWVGLSVGVSGLARRAGSTLSFVFDITLSSGSFAGYEPDFKINWVGTKNNYDLVSKAIDPPGVATTPLPAALPLFASGLGALGLFDWRRKWKGAATTAAA
jgi:hypothetical protein